jgi:hypothetical protein
VGWSEPTRTALTDDPRVRWVLVAAALILVVAALGSFWAPAMAMLSDSSENAGLDQALAFYRRVKAERYVQEGEALLAAAG